MMQLPTWIDQLAVRERGRAAANGASVDVLQLLAAAQVRNGAGSTRPPSIALPLNTRHSCTRG